MWSGTLTVRNDWHNRVGRGDASHCATFHRAHWSMISMTALGVTAVTLVALGGAAGSVARYVTSVLAIEWLGAAFPWGTLAVNAIGSLVIGAMAGADVEGQARLL